MTSADVVLSPLMVRPVDAPSRLAQAVGEERQRGGARVRLTAPKATGYRAVHTVVRRDGRLIEIQLRTLGQHRWAESVERLGSRTGHNLKDGQGPEDLLEYLRESAYLMAMAEEGKPIDSDDLGRVNRLAEQIRQRYLVR
jgi:ppGpp synthetase/RelA/SpoT-type nucleotidyltranferase